MLPPEQKEVNMDSMKLLLCAAAAASLDICAIVMILTAYREKRSAVKRWRKISGDMELVEPGASYPLECDEIILGRHASADIRLPDLSVSRYHAMLTLANGVWTVSDLNSKAGIFVNGKQVKHLRLHENDIIQLGNRRLTLRRRRGKNV